MSNSDGDACVGVCVLILVFCGAIVMCVIGPIVISDYNDTKEFTEQVCSGTQLNHLDINDGVTYSKGTIDTCVVVSSQNQTCTYTVQLFYPPLEHWLLAGKKRKDVQSWAAGLGSTQTFVCYIENPGVNGSKGISDFFDQITGFIVMTVLAVLFLLLVFGCAGYFFCADCWKSCCRKSSTTSSTDRPAWMSPV
jgi:hypothetical protein